MKTLKDLFLALINATLLLAALCLGLALMVVNRANDITETFASNLVTLTPLKEEVAATRQEIAGLRSDVAQLRERSTDAGAASISALDARMDRLDARMDAMQDSLQEIRQLPYDLTDHAIEKAADAFGTLIAPLVARSASAPDA